MDALSRLLTLYPMRTALDLHCKVAAPWVIDHAGGAIGTAPYHLLLSGSAWLDMDGAKREQLKAGDVVVFPRGAAHRLHVGDLAAATPPRPVDADGILQLFVNEGAGAATDLLCGQFVFDAGASNPLLASLPEVIIVRTAGREDFSGLLALITMLKGETENMRPGASAVVGPLSSVLFALMIRAWLEQAASAQGLFALLAERRLQPALQGMLESPEKPWSLDEMADACHMSRSTFVRLFQRVAGASPAAVLLQTRMGHAAHRLAHGTGAVADIGESVGYQSEAAFNRVFKRTYGVGPGQYRRSARPAALGG